MKLYSFFLIASTSYKCSEAGAALWLCVFPPNLSLRMHPVRETDGPSERGYKEVVGSRQRVNKRESVSTMWPPKLEMESWVTACVYSARRLIAIQHTGTISFTDTPLRDGVNQQLVICSEDARRRGRVCARSRANILTQSCINCKHRAAARTGTVWIQLS